MGLPGEAGRQGPKGEQGDSISEQDAWMFKVTKFMSISAKIESNLIEPSFHGRHVKASFRSPSGPD